jgi:hypothetical protein
MSYKWIEFTLQHDTGKTKVYNCYNKEYGSLLGQVKWYAAFRKYSFFPENNIVFETQCLKDIASFLDKLTLERKLDKQKQLS